MSVERKDKELRELTLDYFLIEKFLIKILMTMLKQA